MKTQSTTDWTTYRRLLGYLKGRIWLFAIAIVGFVVAAYAEVVFAQSLGAIVDVFNLQGESGTVGAGRMLPSIPTWATQQGWPLIYTFPLLICAAAFVRGIGSIIGEYLIGHISLHLIHRVRYDLFSVLLDLPARYFDRNSVGSISNRLTDTANRLRDTATEVIRILLQDGFKLIVLMVTLIDLNGMLTLIFVATFPVVGVIVHFASKRFRRISENIQRTMGEVTQVGQEAVGAHKVVKSFGGQDHERRRFFSASNSNRQQNSKLIATKAGSSQFIQFLVALALGGLMGVLFIPQVSASMTTGDLVTYIAVAGVLVQPVRRLSDLNARLQAGLAAASEIFEHMDQSSEKEGKVSNERVQGEIEFRNVTFRYEQDGENAVTDFTFSAKPGQTIAIVGESGSGKSTLVELLMGFYQPTSGEILIDGVATTDYNRNSLRRQVALVSQDIFLFSDTVRNNIAYGELGNIAEDRLNAVLEAARVQRFVQRLPHGIETVVSNRGENLSGGQRQRIAIARALLKDAPILVLDEATSALDPTSETAVLEALREVTRGRTTLLVAHRLSTIRDADYVLVLEKGRIIEQGTLEQLEKNLGHFSTLFKHANRSEVAVEPTHSETTEADTVIAGELQSKLVANWYAGKRWLKTLNPLSRLFQGIASVRRKHHSKRAWLPPVPLIVVGNISVGGTGKTPLVIWLAKWLQKRGKRVGLVSRGYRSHATHPVTVNKKSSWKEVGDEAPLLVERTGCTMVVDPDRVQAVKTLLQKDPVDVIISDDGLQHYHLGRHIEIVVLDGERGLGNGEVLPAGPLRESADRLGEVDWVVSNGTNQCGIRSVDDTMFVRPVSLVNIHSQQEISATAFKEEVGENVVAYSAIGNHNRFLTSLRQLGLSAQHFQLPDHGEFAVSHFQHPEDSIVVVTEKDFRKIKNLEIKAASVWFLRVDVEFDKDVESRLEALCRSNGIEFD